MWIVIFGLSRGIRGELGLLRMTWIITALE
jgi:hypothetical protein